MVFGDFSSGVGWEVTVNTYEIRDKTEARINEIFSGFSEYISSCYSNQPIYQPVQTAPPYPNLVGTPDPN